MSEDSDHRMVVRKMRVERPKLCGSGAWKRFVICKEFPEGIEGKEGGRDGGQRCEREWEGPTLRLTEVSKKTIKSELYVGEI